jgi:hypothetical protein
VERKKLIKTIFLAIISLGIFPVMAQQQNLPLNRELRLNYEKYLYKTDKKHPFHTAVKPYLQSEVYQFVDPDTTYGLEKLDPTSGFKKFINVVGYGDWVRFDENGFIKPTETVVVDGDTIQINTPNQGYKKRKFYIAANPIVRFDIGRGANDEKSSYNLRGLEIMANIGEKVSVYTAFLENQAIFPEYISIFVRGNRVAPGEGKVRNFKDKGFDFSRAMGALTYTPNTHFTLELGHGKHFIGDGYRSLLLSDNSFVYPYIKFTTQFWKIKYVNIYSELINNVQNETDFTLGFPRKLATFNYLSLAATPWLSLGVFEGIIWRSSTADGKRKFDANFLNPIIGIRALQKNLDANKVYGLNASINLPKHIVLYGQLMINQFSTSLRSIENRSGMQLGAKYYDVFGVKNLNILAEYNIVRPYSYQNESDTILSYSHYNQALAHPMGAGFDEIVFLANYRYKRFVAEVKINAGRSSVDGPGLNVGTDITLATNEAAYVDQPQIGQGILGYKVANGEIRIGYILNPKINMMIEAKLQVRKYKFDSSVPGLDNSDLKMFSIGLNTRLFNHYYDVPINF